MWLIAENVAREMQVRIDAGLEPTDAAHDEFATAVLATDEPRNLKVIGDTAEIAIDGLLTERPDFFAMLFGFGNTTYQEIRDSLKLADADPAVKRIRLDVNSPGGTVDGFFDTLAAIDATRKPIAVRTKFAASAAYGLAAVAGPITATDAAVQVGSIGVAQSFYVSDHRIDVTSTEAPNKRPDVRTEQGRAVVREELDALHELFAEAIAHGRGTSVEDVNANFGRGSVLIASEAKARGMIDGIERPALRAVPPAEVEPSGEATAAALQVSKAVSQAAEVAPTDSPVSVSPAPTPTAGATRERSKMDSKTLQAEHPEVHAEIMAEGERRERDRVLGHLILGEQSGALSIAIEAIRDGSSMTQELTARYVAAGMNRADATKRQTETDEAGAAVDGAPAEAEAEDLGDKVVSILEARAGKDPK